MNTKLDIPLDQHEREARLLYSIIVAGKSADFTDRALAAFLGEVERVTKSPARTVPPLKMLESLSSDEVMCLLQYARTGNYTKIARACVELVHEDINLETCTPADLEKIHGIGPKTSRFFIMWTRPHERYAALDVHILRWLKAQGYDVPRHTPQSGKQYAKIEQWFLDEAQKRGKTPRELDEEIWIAGAGRTQKTALPVQAEMSL